jgi:hypothetical protein
MVLMYLHQIQGEVEGTQKVEQFFTIGIFAHGGDQSGGKTQLVEVEGYIHGSASRNCSCR